MRAIIMSCVCLGLAVAPFEARADADMSCSRALQILSAEWRAIGVATPSKPAQTRVAARDGRSFSGAQVHYMLRQLSLADRECRNGDEDGALKRVAVIQHLLLPASVTTAVTDVP